MYEKQVSRHTDTYIYTKAAVPLIRKLPRVHSKFENEFKDARESFYVEGGLVCSPMRDPRATVRGFQRASDASCKQQWRLQLK